MDAIKLYLERFKIILPPDDQLKALLIEIIADECKVPLDKKDISVSKWSVFIKAPASAKSEIFLHQEKIMERLTVSLTPGLKKII